MGCGASKGQVLTDVAHHPSSPSASKGQPSTSQTSANCPKNAPQNSPKSSPMKADPPIMSPQSVAVVVSCHILDSADLQASPKITPMGSNQSTPAPSPNANHHGAITSATSNFYCNRAYPPFGVPRIRTKTYNAT
jgi:hypothetical protein